MSGVPRTFVNTGDRFKRLTVINPEAPRMHITEKYKWGQRAAECQCDCGARVAVPLRSLRSGSIVSCGCYRREDTGARTTARLTTHGMTGHPLFATWKGIMARCYNPRATGYHNYGGRGVAVCAEWHEAGTFIGWVEANLGPRARGMTIDRIDTHAGYEPGNLRWATKSQQRTNQRPGLLTSRSGNGRFAAAGEVIP